MENIKILIADDVKIQRTILKNIVDKIDFAEFVGAAENGQVEYELIKKLNPTLVLTDNQMPILNGVDVIKKIRKDRDNEIDFIIITGDRGLFAEVKDFNIYGILNKPYNDSDLVNMLEEYKLEKEYRENNVKEEHKEIEKKKGFFSKLFGN